MLVLALNMLIVAIGPFLLLGLIGRVKAFWAGRQGPSVFQPFRDCVKLLRKGEVLSSSGSFVLRIAPSGMLAAILCASLFSPLVSGKPSFPLIGDFLVFAYLLALARFLQIIAALDVGSSFEGMGASREALFSSLMEPAFFVIVGSLSGFSGKLSFSGMQEFLLMDAPGQFLISGMCAVAFLLMLVVEGCRVPVDDPQTHLELTMIHEVMVLDTSGPDLAFVLYSTGLKMVLVVGLISAVMIPPSLPLWLAFAGIVMVLVVVSLIVGTIESLTARLRMTHVPQFILFMFSLALMIFAFGFFGSKGGQGG